MTEFSPGSLRELLAGRFDEIIDVRSPGEFRIDKIPAAINLPVLNDRERELVGTIYRQEDRFKAHRIGAAFVARNIADHLEGHFCDKPGNYHPLLYCWRGGKRSESMATIVSSVGWRATTLRGGYKSYRRMIVELLYTDTLDLPVVLLEGYTGSAKTAILRLLAEMGVQTINLESIANHRGSVFGARIGGQPSQKAFESTLAGKVVALRPGACLVLEAESNRIGRLLIPPSIWQAMQSAGRIVLQASARARAKHVVGSYDRIARDKQKMTALLKSLRSMHAADTIEYWIRLSQSGMVAELAQELITRHYDPRYASHRERVAKAPLLEIDLREMRDTDLDRAAATIADFLVRRRSRH